MEFLVLWRKRRFNFKKVKMFLLGIVTLALGVPSGAQDCRTQVGVRYRGVRRHDRRHGVRLDLHARFLRDLRLARRPRPEGEARGGSSVNAGRISRERSAEGREMSKPFRRKVRGARRANGKLRVG